MAEMDNERGQAEGDSCRKISMDEIKESLQAEITEMEKYKWYLGERLHHDPLQDRSLNEIYCEWIDKYAADFRRDWDKKKHGDLQTT